MHRRIVKNMVNKCTRAIPVYPECDNTPKTQDVTDNLPTDTVKQIDSPKSSRPNKYEIFVTTKVIMRD